MASNEELTIDLGVDTQETINIEVDLDAKVAIESMEELQSALESVRKNIGALGKEIANALKPVEGSLSGVQKGVDTLCNALTETMVKIETLMKQLTEEQQTDTVLGAISTSVDGLALALDAITSADKLKEVFASVRDGMGVFGEVQSYISNTVSETVQGITSMESTVSGALGEASEWVKQGTAAWADNTVAKNSGIIADSQILANLTENTKGFGNLVVQIISSTASWMAETAAKIASTAAQLALTAATTAWKGICVVATAVTTAFGAAISFLTSPIGLVVAAITAVIAVVALLITNWDAVAAKAKEVWGGIQQRFTDFSNFLSGVFAADWSAQFGAFGHVLNGFLDMVEGIFTVVKSIFSGIIGFITGVFSGDWQKAWSSIVGLFKGIWDGVTAVIKVPLNGIIGIINGLLGSACNGINGIIKLLNGLKFTIPDWVPGIGGSSIGFNIKQLTPPQIPYLAKGAVLPANRPFLAVVGDQRHGTNIEAPLATIQEAVAVVMEEHIAAMMAGFQALLEEQRALRQCVESIEVGDDVIGQATARYNRKMAMVRGGY